MRRGIGDRVLVGLMAVVMLGGLAAITLGARFGVSAYLTGFAVGQVVDVIRDAFKATGTTPEDLDWFVPHQANRRIIEASADKLGIAREKVVITVDRHGNTSAASIPLALDAARKDGRIKQGDLVMLEAIGGGFTWGSALVRW